MCIDLVLKSTLGLYYTSFISEQISLSYVYVNKALIFYRCGTLQLLFPFVSCLQPVQLNVQTVDKSQKSVDVTVPQDGVETNVQVSCIIGKLSELAIILLVYGYVHDGKR